MQSFWSTLLFPFTSGVSAVLAGAHDVLTRLGLPGGPTWALSIVMMVVVVRLALLPLVVRQVRAAHASAAAYPQLAAIRRRYRGRTGPEALRRQAEEIRAVHAEHGLGVIGYLPLVVQLPVMSALYLVLRDLSAGTPVASMTAALVQSASESSVAGVALATTLTTAGGVTSTAFWVLVAVVALAAGLGYLTQRWFVLPNLPTHALEGQAGQFQRIAPALAAVATVVGAPLLPAGVMVYVATSAVWTLLQQAVITAVAPTPGSVAATRRA